MSSAGNGPIHPTYPKNHPDIKTKPMLKKVLYTLLALTLLAGIKANAQRDTIRPAGDSKTEGARKKMVAQLGLTKKQASQFKEVNKEFAPKIKALRADSATGKMQKRKQLMDLMKERDEKLKNFLTPEQMDKMHELQKEQMKNRRNNKGNMEEEDPS
jgi:Spy/CpxP family protein refolding chaperone